MLVMESSSKCLHVCAGATYTDPGATAVDNTDGNLTSSLATYGIGAVSTTKPTGTTYFTVTYTVQVSQGASTEAMHYNLAKCRSLSDVKCQVLMTKTDAQCP